MESVNFLGLPKGEQEDWVKAKEEEDEAEERWGNEKKEMNKEEDAVEEEKWIRWRRLRWKSRRQVSFLGGIFVAKTVKEYENKPDRATMRPDCVFTCIDHVTYMDRQMDKQAGGTTK